MSYVIKRSDREPEKFDVNKLHASIVGTCLAVRVPSGEAKTNARKVCEDMADWLTEKAEITTTDIRHQASKSLTKLNPDAAYYYAEQKKII